MAAVAVPNGVLVRLLYTQEGKPTMNVGGMSVPPTFSVTQAIVNTMATTMSGYWTSSGLAALMAPNTIFTGVAMIDLRTLNMPTITSTVLNDPGTSTGIPLPRQTALVWTLRTAQAGRQFRGRWFLGGWAQNAQEPTDGNATAAAGTAGQAWFGAWIAAMGTAGGASGLIQRFLPARPGKGGVTLPERQPAVIPITILVQRNNVWDTMRRRIRPIAR